MDEQDDGLVLNNWVVKPKIVESCLIFKPAFNKVGKKVGLTSNEVLTILAGKRIHGNGERSFTARQLSAFAGISYKNISPLIQRLHFKGHFRRVRRHNGNLTSTRYCITPEGMGIVNKMEVAAFEAWSMMIPL